MAGGTKNLLLRQAQFLNVAQGRIGKTAAVSFCGVWHSRGIRRVPFRDVALLGYTGFDVTAISISKS